MASSRLDVTLACEGASSKLVEVVTVADVNAEKRFDDSLVQIWKLKFGNELNFCSDFEDFLKLGQYFAADAWLR